MINTQALSGIPEAPPQTLKVLVVEDEPGLRDFLKWELSNQGISVQTAENGRDGIRRMAETTFDVIITDITMPEMDGMTFLEAVKKNTRDTPVILMTGFGAVETAVHAFKNGAFDFLLKPFDTDYLMTRVRQAGAAPVKCRTCGGTE